MGLFIVNHKPMLAVDCGGVENLRFPLVVSPKLDGVRAITTDGPVLSRSLKPIPNKHVQELLDGLPSGLDGELLAGEPHAPDVYRKTVSMVMSDDAPITDLKYYLFDCQLPGSFTQREILLRGLYQGLENKAALVLVPQVTVNSLDDLLVFEEGWVTRGFEGLIARAPGSPYKHGRSTEKEGYLVKVKRFQDGEAEVIGVTELMHNANEATVNELGRTARSHKKAGMEATGTMGTLVVRDTKTGVEFEIGTGFTADERRDLWHNSQVLPSWEWPLAKYKHFPSGAKDKPRHPVFLGWRDKRDA